MASQYYDGRIGHDPLKVQWQVTIGADKRFQFSVLDGDEQPRDITDWIYTATANDGFADYELTVSTDVPSATILVEAPRTITSQWSVDDSVTFKVQVVDNNGKIDFPIVGVIDLTEV